MSEALKEIEQIFLAFGDKTRLRILNLLRNGEVSVNYLCGSLNISQPKVSRHLAYLRKSGVVNTRRDGKWIYYRISEPQGRLGAKFLGDALDWISSIPELNVESIQPDRARTPEDVGRSRRIRTAPTNDNIYGQPYVLTQKEELEVYLL